MTTATEIHPNYVTNGSGRQTAVIIQIEEYNGLLEDLCDLATVAERVSEPTIPHAQVVGAEFVRIPDSLKAGIVANSAPKPQIDE